MRSTEQADPLWRPKGCATASEIVGVRFPLWAETAAEIEAIKADLGATGLKDMGRVMAELKARHASELDMSKASAAVKAALS